MENILSDFSSIRSVIQRDLSVFILSIIYDKISICLISRTPDCNSVVPENVLDCIETYAIYGMLSYASFDDIVKLKNPSAIPQTAPAHTYCFWILEPISLSARKFHI